jgi:hypothetical protein
MRAHVGPSPSTLRRIKQLAYVIERKRRLGSSLSYGEVGRALYPGADKPRARQLVD